VPIITARPQAGVHLNRWPNARDKLRAIYLVEVLARGPRGEEDMNLDGRIAVVTGGTQGVGRGIARVLAQKGARVFITGRTAAEQERFDAQITGIRCDHREDAQVEAVFKRVANEAGPITILVNNVWGGYEDMIENGAFTWSKPF